MADGSSWVYWSMTDYGGLSKSEWPKHYDLADSSTSLHLTDAEWTVQYGKASGTPAPFRPSKRLTLLQPTVLSHRAPSLLTSSP